MMSVLLLASIVIKVTSVFCRIDPSPVMSGDPEFNFISDQGLFDWNSKARFDQTPTEHEFHDTTTELGFEHSSTEQPPFGHTSSPSPSHSEVKQNASTNHLKIELEKSKGIFEKQPDVMSVIRNSKLLIKFMLSLGQLEWLGELFTKLMPNLAFSQITHKHLQDLHHHRTHAAKNPALLLTQNHPNNTYQYQHFPIHKRVKRSLTQPEDTKRNLSEPVSPATSTPQYPGRKNLQHITPSHHVSIPKEKEQSHHSNFQNNNQSHTSPMTNLSKLATTSSYISITRNNKQLNAFPSSKYPILHTSSQNFIIPKKLTNSFPITKLPEIPKMNLQSKENLATSNSLRVLQNEVFATKLHSLSPHFITSKNNKLSLSTPVTKLLTKLSTSSHHLVPQNIKQPNSLPVTKLPGITTPSHNLSLLYKKKPDVLPVSKLPKIPVSAHRLMVPLNKKQPHAFSVTKLHKVSTSSHHSHTHNLINTKNLPHFTPMMKHPVISRQKDIPSPLHSIYKVGIKNVKPMTDLQLQSLYQAIIAKIVNAEKGYRPTFGGISLEPGWLLISCENQQAKEWLENCVASLKPWPGAKLSIIQVQDFPKLNVGIVYIPDPEAKNIQTTLNLLRVQNGLNTELWKVLKKKEEDGGVTLTLSIDDQSFDTLKQNELKAYLAFDSVQFHIKNKTKPTRSTHKLSLPDPDAPIYPNLVPSNTPSASTSAAPKATAGRARNISLRFPRNRGATRGKSTPTVSTKRPPYHKGSSSGRHGTRPKGNQPD